MSINVNVEFIANKIRTKLNSVLENEIAEIMQEVSNNNISSTEAIGQTVAVIKNHSERFTVELIQKVVNELQRS